MGFKILGVVVMAWTLAMGVAWLIGKIAEAQRAKALAGELAEDLWEHNQKAADALAKMETERVRREAPVKKPAPKKVVRKTKGETK